MRRRAVALWCALAVAFGAALLGPVPVPAAATLSGQAGPTTTAPSHVVGHDAAVLPYGIASAARPAIGGPLELAVPADGDVWALGAGLDRRADTADTADPHRGTSVSARAPPDAALV